MKIVIISGGNIQKDFALSFLEEYLPDTIIGVDGGLDFCKKNGVILDYVMGDFDSVSPCALSFFKEKKVPIFTFPSQKDDTDTELAIKKACELKAKEIMILGGTGSRLDHVLGNLQVLYRTVKKGISCYMIDACNKITILLPGETKVEKKVQHGKYTSFLPFSQQVTDLSLLGFAYPLKDYKMTKDTSLGVSNEIIEACATVSFKDGALIMIQSKD